MLIIVTIYCHRQGEESRTDPNTDNHHSAEVASRVEEPLHSRSTIKNSVICTSQPKSGVPSGLQGTAVIVFMQVMTCIPCLILNKYVSFNTHFQIHVIQLAALARDNWFKGKSPFSCAWPCHDHICSKHCLTKVYLKLILLNRPERRRGVWWCVRLQEVFIMKAGQGRLHGGELITLYAMWGFEQYIANTHQVAVWTTNRCKLAIHRAWIYEAIIRLNLPRMVSRSNIAASIWNQI